MGDLFSGGSTASQSTTAAQAAAQGGSGGATVGVGGGNSGSTVTAQTGNADVSLPAAYVAGSLTIQSSDPSTVARALDTVDLANYGADTVALDSINSSQTTTIAALSDLQSVEQNTSVMGQNEFNTASQLANNAQELANGQGTQSIGTSDSYNNLMLYLTIAGIGLSIWYLLKKQ